MDESYPGNRIASQAVNVDSVLTDLEYALKQLHRAQDRLLIDSFRLDAARRAADAVRRVRDVMMAFPRDAILGDSVVRLTFTDDLHGIVSPSPLLRL